MVQVWNTNGGSDGWTKGRTVAGTMERLEVDRGERGLTY